MRGHDMFEYIDYSQTFIEEIQRLASPYLIGDFNSCEVTEIFGFANQSMPPINLYTLIVFEKSGECPYEPHHLTPNLIKLNGLRGWSFGIQSSRITPDDLYATLADLFSNKGWGITGKSLETGILTALPRKFVPAEAKSIPVNGLLKNNFWNGSYIFELFAQEKELVSPFFDAPTLLQDLSKKIEPYRPINLAINSERLGSIIIQMPVKCVRWNISSDWSNSIKVSLDWSDEKYQRPCQLSVISENDDIINDTAIYDFSDQEIVIQGNFDGIEKLILWDKYNRLTLGAVSSVYYIKEFYLGLRPISPEPRTVVINESDGTKNSFHVMLQHSVPSKISRREPSDISGWTRKRIYKEKIDKVAKTLEFVQYLHGDKEKALNDIRKLINMYGENCVCLWDPYLTARDIMHTLYYSSSMFAKIYALGSGYASKRGTMVQGTNISYSEWKHEQISILTEPGNNNLGLDLEFRVSRGMDNAGFHDRFLIFPNTDDGSKAWSLGISVNALGTSHHILQSTSNPQMIVDGFFKFWNNITDADNIIWRSRGKTSR